MSEPVPMNILLLEDHGVVRHAMRTELQMTEPLARVHEASSYAQAMDLLASHAFDVAFLDHDLGEERTGFDVLEHIHENCIETKAIILSGRDDRATIMDCLAAGASGFIPKAAEGEGIFRRAIDTVFQGGVYLPSSALGKGGYTPVTAPVTAESAGVTGRQLEVLYYLCRGLQYKVIAWKMDISEHTVRKDYVTALLRRFNVPNRVELMLEISRRRIVVPQPARELGSGAI